MHQQDPVPVKRVERDFEDLNREYGAGFLFIYKLFTTWWLLRLVVPYIDRAIAWYYTTEKEGEGANNETRSRASPRSCTEPIGALHHRDLGARYEIGACVSSHRARSEDGHGD